MQYPYPKIDLHLHLDGSLPLTTAYRLAKERNLITDSKQTFMNSMHVKKDCQSLQDYLSCFDNPLAILQDTDALYEATYDLIIELKQQNILYAEIRFAPQMHTKNGCSQKEIIEAVLHAYQDTIELIAPNKVQFILCMMTLGEAHVTHEANLETLQLARAYYGKGVVAIDLAGAEGITPIENFRYLFEKAQELHLPYTIHAGESGTYHNIESAISFGAKRIGHGKSCIDSINLMNQLKDTQLPLELCATSNIHCHVVSSISEHPIKKLFDNGINITINTDNMTISNTTLDKEYELLQTHLGFQYCDFIKINRNALLASFLQDDEKKRLLNIYDKITKGFVQ